MSEQPASSETSNETPGFGRRLAGGVRRLQRGVLLVLGKLSRMFYILLITLLVILGWLLFTTGGAQWLAERAMEEDPRLALTVRAGSLWNGLELEAVSWHDSGVVVAVDSARTRWNPLCLLQLHVCLGQLHAEGVSVAVDTTRLPPAEPREGPVEIPVTAEFPDVDLRDVDITVDGHRVAWQAVTVAGTLGRRNLRLESVRTAGLDVAVELPATAKLAEEQPADSANGGMPAELDLPLDIYLASLQMRDTRVDLGGDVQELAALDLSADLVGRELLVRQFHTDGLSVVVPRRVTPEPEGVGDSDAVAVAGEGGSPDAAPLLPAELDLPLDVRIESLRLRDTRVDLDGDIQQLELLSLSAELTGNELLLREFRTRGLSVVLPQPPDVAVDVEEDPAPGDPLDIAVILDPAGRGPIVLPDIVPPLDVRIEILRIEESLFVLGEDRHELALLDLSAAMRGSDLRVEHLRLEHPQLSARLAGNLGLAGEYPLDLRLEAEARGLLDGQDGRLEAVLSGSLRDLMVDVGLDGPARIALTGTAQPLEPAAGMDLELRWEELGWPLEGDRLVFSERGSLSVQGDLNAFTVSADLGLEGEDVPRGHWELAGDGDYRGINLEHLRGQVLDGRLQLAGQLGWEGGLDWDLRLQAAGINASALAEGAPDGVGLRLASTGRLVGEDLTLDADLAHLEATVQGYALTGQGRVAHRPETGWRIDALRVDAAEGHVQLAGTVGEELDLSGSLAFPALGRLLPELRGAVEGRFTARGALETPDVDLALSGSGLGWEDLVRLDGLDLEARILGLGEGDSRLALAADGLVLPEQDIHVGSIRLNGEGRRDAHRFSLDVADGPAEVSLEVRGTLDEALAWSGSLERVQLDGAGLTATMEAPTAIRWDPERGQALVDTHCWLHDSARLCATERMELGARGQVAMELRQYQLHALSPWLPEEVVLLGELAMDLRASWSDDGSLPRADGELRISDGGVQFTTDLDDGFDPEELELSFERFVVSLQTDRDRIRSAVELLSSDLGEAVVDATIAVRNGTELGEIDGNLRLSDLNLALLEPFFLELRALRGEINAEGRVTGDVRSPRFDGRLVLSDGRVETLAVPVDLRDIGIEIDVRGERAELAGSFRSGEGRARLNGDMDWSGESWQAELGLQGDRLEAAYDTIATLRVSPDLQLRVRPREVFLSGRIVIPEGDITIRELPPSAVRVSGDVVVIDDVPETEPDEDGETQPIPTVEGWDINTRIEIVLGNRIHLSGYGLTGRLTGQLGITQEGEGAPQANGEINIVDGRYRAYGQRLLIRRGQFLFAGPVDRPDINVEAIREVSRYNVIAGLRVEGRPEDPRVSLFSEPALPEEEVLSYLLLGRPLGEGGAGGDEMMVRAALALGIAGGGGTATAIAEGLGVQDFQIDTAGEGDETQFMVGGYIGPNLFLSYGVGVFIPVNALTLRYELTNNLYLEAVSSLENALDLFYTFQF